MGMMNVMTRSHFLVTDILSLSLTSKHHTDLSDVVVQKDVLHAPHGVMLNHRHHLAVKMCSRSGTNV